MSKGKWNARRMIGLTGVLLFSFFSYGEEFALSQYPYPVQNRFIATLTGAIEFNPCPVVPLQFEFLPWRKKVKLAENKHLFQAGLYPQSDLRAPLVFIISGTGGTAFSPLSMTVACQLQKEGFAVVTLPNPVSWEYAVFGSYSGFPGWLRSDARELHEHMKKILDHLAKVKKMNPAKTSLVGFSLGALIAGFIQEHDRQNPFFNFYRTVLLSPPVDLKFSIRVLDQFYKIGNDLSEARRAWAKSTAIDLALEGASRKYTQEQLANRIREAKPSTKDLQYLIGDSFRMNFASLIWVGQQISDWGLLKSGTPSSFIGRIDESKTISFWDYTTKFLPKVFSWKGSVNEELFSASLLSLKAELSASSNMYVFQNLDDFLLQKSDSDFLRQAVHPTRLSLFPLGGHCGNFWYPANQAKLSRVLSGQE